MLNLESLVQRYGITYYLMRMSVIEPGRLLYHAFGITTGFFVLHYLVIVVATASVLLIVRRLSGTSVALCSVILFLFSPWYLRSNVWDYVDGFALTYLLAGLAFSIVPSRGRLVWSACGAFCFALATNANLFTIAVWVTFYIALILIKGRQPVAPVARKAIAIVVGFVVGYACLAVAVNLARPGLGPFFELFTIHVAARLLGGGSASYYHDLGGFIAEGNLYVFVPLIIAIAGLIAIRIVPGKEGDGRFARPTRLFLLYLAFLVVVYLVNNYVFHSPRITLPYYFCYLLIPSYLLVFALIGRMRRRLTIIGDVLLALTAIVCVVLWRLYPQIVPSRNLALASLLLLCALLLAAALLQKAAPSVAFASMLAFAIVLPLVFISSPSHYSELFGPEGTAYGNDVSQGAVQLIATVERVSPPTSAPLLFWYNWHRDKHWFLLSMQSVYLFAYSLVDSYAPETTEKLLARLQGTPDLAILGLTTGEVNEAIEALRRVGVDTRILGTVAYNGTQIRYVAKIVAILPHALTPRKLLRKIPGSSLHNVSRFMPSSIVESDAIQFTTDPRQWAYSLATDLASRMRDITGPIRVCVDAKVSTGAIGVALSRPGNISLLTKELQVDAGGVTGEYCLPPEDASSIGYVVVRNRSASGPSAALIRSIGVFRP